MTKRNISIALAVLMLLTNIYLIWRVSSDTMTIASYDAGISQKTGVGRMESFWTNYIGGSKRSSVSAEDRENAETDRSTSIAVLVVLDVAIVGVLYFLNRKPKPAPVATEEEDDWRRERRPRRRRR